jgi:hypothetical protein
MAEPGLAPNGAHFKQLEVAKLVKSFGNQP